MFKVIFENVELVGTLSFQKGALDAALVSFEKKLNGEGISEVLTSSAHESAHGITLLSIVKFDEPKKPSAKK